MIETSYIYGLAGGLIIGIAGAALLLGNGRIMGASGILGGIVDGTAGPGRKQSLLFLAGLVLAPWVAILALDLAPTTQITSNPLVIVAGGLLVGLGSRIANGCTSGHGVCGISRLSPRGIAATVFYLIAGGMSVLVFKHLLEVI